MQIFAILRGAQKLIKIHRILIILLITTIIKQSFNKQFFALLNF